jgi:glycolate oxidase FAD binding subunit
MGARAGGMVVKNVSGYDMARLYLGSLGTLGVIVSANFKVLPRPRSEATIIAGFTAPQEAFAQASRLRQSLEPVAALEVARLDGRWLLAARLEGRDAAVSAAASRIMSAITSADVTSIDTDASMEWWRHHVAQQALPTADHTAIVRCGGRPKETSTLTAGIMAALDDLGGSVPYLAASPGLGAVVAQVAFGPAGSGEILAALQMRLLGLAETATILAAPPDWKRGIDVWGRLPEGFDVMRALREQFDPQRTINPGRFAGFL